MTMQTRTAVGNSRKREANKVKYQNSGNVRIVRDADSRHARAQISEKHTET